MKERKPLTLAMLKKIVDRTLQDHPAHENLTVAIFNTNGTISGSAFTPIVVAGRGFDWYSGKFMLSTTNPMFEQKPEPPPAPKPPAPHRIKEFPDQPKPVILPESYDRGSCEKCGEGYDNEEEWKYNTHCELCGHPIPKKLIIKRK